MRQRHKLRHRTLLQPHTLRSHHHTLVHHTLPLSFHRLPLLLHHTLSVLFHPLHLVAVGPSPLAVPLPSKLFIIIIDINNRSIRTIARRHHVCVQMIPLPVHIHPSSIPLSLTLPSMACRRRGYAQHMHTGRCSWRLPPSPKRSERPHPWRCRRIQILPLRLGERRTL